MIISSWSKRMISHIGTEMRPKFLLKAIMGNFLQRVTYIGSMDVVGYIMRVFMRNSHTECLK